MTKNSIAYNRTLFLEDNLPVLRGLDSDSIDLIATDPPFNKGVPAFTGTTKAGENVEFKDIWNWNDDVHDGWMEQMSKRHPSLSNVILYANAAAGYDMGAFLCWMAVRVLEMRRVLKDTGSMYLHCDPTASHYLKAMMDAIFGRKNFRNEIVWNRTIAKSNATRGLPVNHDVLFRYSVSDSFTWNSEAVTLPYDLNNLSEKTAKKYRHKDPDGRLYQLDNITAPIQDPNSNLTYEIMGVTRTWRWTRERMQKAIDDGIVIQTKPGNVPRQIRYLDEQKGKPLSSVWTDIFPLNSQAIERTGYPTQKPLALYKRMIEASSNPGDMVLDPFMGCATTCVAAEQLGRDWIGIDIREESGDVIRERLENEVNGSMAWDAIVRTPTSAPERTDDGEPAAPELAVVGRKRNVKQIPVSELRKQLIVRDGQRCQGCGWEARQPEYLQVDHNQPKSLQGTDEMDNLALLCEPCNRKKSNRLTLHELRLERAASEEGWMNMEWWEKEKWKR